MNYNHYGHEPDDRKSQVKEGAKILGLSVGGFIAAVVAVVLAGVVVMFATGTAQRLTADWRGETKQIEQVKADPNYRIANYEWFYNTNEGVKALETKICRMKENTSLPEDQIATNVLALENQRTSLIADYNARAQQNDTRANYLSSDLPYQIEENYAC